jgi:hypothetical protein
MKVFLALFCYSLLMIAGQLFFSNASKSATGGIYSIILSSDFWMAVGIYGISSVAWVLLLRIMPVRIAYPSAAAITSIILYLHFAMNSAGSASLSTKFNELIGIAFIVAGLFLVYKKI